MLINNDGWAIITGATSGIGLSFAKRLAVLGMPLVITGRRQELLHERRSELVEMGAPRVDVITGDLADASVVERIIAAIDERECDLLINNAGYGTSGRVDELESDALVPMVEVLASVPLRLCRAVLPQMRSRGAGTIINVGSLAGNVAVPEAATYVSCKAFVERLSESLALENIDSGVVVQALTPGFVKTDFHRDVTDYRATQESKGLIRWMDSQSVVDLSLRRAELALRRIANPDYVPSRRLVVVVPGFWNRVLLAFSRIVPRSLAYRGALTRARR